MHASMMGLVGWRVGENGGSEPRTTWVHFKSINVFSVIRRIKKQHPLLSPISPLVSPLMSLVCSSCCKTILIKQALRSGKRGGAYPFICVMKTNVYFTVCSTARQIFIRLHSPTLNCIHKLKEYQRSTQLSGFPTLYFLYHKHFKFLLASLTNKNQRHCCDAPPGLPSQSLMFPWSSHLSIYLFISHLIIYY